MADYTFGELDWDKVDFGGDGGGAGRNSFAKLTEGHNNFRILSNPIQFSINWIKTKEGKDLSIRTPVESPDLVRRLEDAGFKRQMRWIFKVIDRSDNKPKLLEVGSQIMRGIDALRKNPKWGKLSSYDICITRHKKGTNPLYSIQADPPESLEKNLVEDFKKFSSEIDVEKLVMPTSQDKVLELLGWEKSPQRGKTQQSRVVEEEEDPIFE
jgi:hypothetical protein